MDNKFEKVFNEITQNIDKLEQSRINSRNEFIKATITVLVIILIPFIAFRIITTFLTTTTGLFISIFLFIASVCCLIKIDYTKFFSKERIRQYKLDYKAHVIKPLIDSFGSDLSYYPELGFSEVSYHDAEFEECDVYSSEDLIKGKLDNNCEFTMGEVTTQEQVSSNKSSYFISFHGLVSEIELINDFRGKFYLRQDENDTSILNKFSINKQSFYKMRVKLDSTEFENNFDVYSSDRMLATRLLTADIMELLMDFQKQTKIPFEITVKYYKMYIRFHTDWLFENPSMFVYSINKDKIYSYYKILDFTFTLTNKIIELIDNLDD